MALYIVRHAKAGSRSEYDGDDRDRPLTNSGRKQANELALRLASVTPTVIVSSPYRRCIETVEPLAVLVNCEVRIDDVLGEVPAGLPKPTSKVITLLRSLPDRSVLCSHGDVIPEVIGSLAGSGMHINGEAHWGKAAVWMIQRVDEWFVEAQAWPPPEFD